MAFQLPLVLLYQTVTVLINGLILQLHQSSQLLHAHLGQILLHQVLTKLTCQCLQKGALFIFVFTSVGSTRVHVVEVGWRFLRLTEETDRRAKVLA